MGLSSPRLTVMAVRRPTVVSLLLEGRGQKTVRRRDV